MHREADLFPNTTHALVRIPQLSHMAHISTIEVLVNHVVAVATVLTLEGIEAIEASFTATDIVSSTLFRVQDVNVFMWSF